MSIKHLPHQGLLSKLIALFLISAITACSAGNDESSSPVETSCVLIDNDYDIDDMQAIPLVIGNKYVAAIIQSEGYTLPEEGAAAVEQLVNNLPDQPNQRKIPIIVGGKQGANGKQDVPYPWLPFFRSMMNLSNGLLSSLPTPAPTDPAYVQKVVNAVSNCTNVSILIIGTYTSFINYSPAIANKIDRVVIMGQPIGDESRTPGRESFNCRYDEPACRTAMNQLQQFKSFFVDIPRIEGCDTANPPVSCYSPSYEMVAGNDGAGGISGLGLPNRLKNALINDIQCQSFYTEPGKEGNPCTSLSTWVPADVVAGPGGEMLLWDQTAAIFLINPDIFSLYYPLNNPSIGGKHYEPNLVNNSHEETVARLRTLWTQYTNSSTNFANQ